MAAPLPTLAVALAVIRLTPAFVLALALTSVAAEAQAFAVPPLDTVRGIELFRGNEAQRAVLQRLGFVVLDRRSGGMHSLSDLPPFVTVDVALHAVALQQRAMLRQIERVLAPVLRAFCERALALALDGRANDEIYNSVARFIALGRRAHGDPWQPASQVAELLRAPESREDPWRAQPAVAVAPSSPYAGDDELTAYFRARWWFTVRAFDTSVPRHARVAAALGRLIASDDKLRQAYDLLRTPLAPWLGPATMPDMTAVASARGRCCLLPPRELPCAVVMDRAAEVQGTLPSPFDVLALGPLRSAAGHELVVARSKAVTADELRAVTLPAAAPSLYVEFLAAVASVQVPGANAPPLFVQPAWQRHMCETQLGAWATVRELFALMYIPRALGGRSDEPPPGRVAPYPHTFAAVARLARGLERHLRSFDTQVSVGVDAHDLVAALRRQPTVMAKNAAEEVRDHLYYATELCDRFGPGSWRQNEAAALPWLEEIATKQAGGRALATDEQDFVRALASDRCMPLHGLGVVARTCEHFAAIAQRQLDGEALTADDLRLLANLDDTIRDMHSSGGAIDLPVVTPVATDPDGSHALWLGTRSPAVLFLVLDEAGTPTLFCGAELLGGDDEVNKLNAWWQANEERFGANETREVAVDVDLVELGTSNRTPDFFVAVIVRLEKDGKDALAARLIARYLPKEVEGTAAGVRGFWEHNRASLFFSDVGGYRWFVDPRPRTAAPAPSKN